MSKPDRSKYNDRLMLNGCLDENSIDYSAFAQTFRSPIADIIYGTAPTILTVSTPLGDDQVSIYPRSEPMDIDEDKVKDDFDRLAKDLDLKNGWMEFIEEIKNSDVVVIDSVPTKTSVAVDICVSRNKENYPIAKEGYEVKVLKHRGKTTSAGQKKVFEVTKSAASTGASLRLSKLALAMVVAQPMFTTD